MENIFNDIKKLIDDIGITNVIIGAGVLIIAIILIIAINSSKRRAKQAKKSLATKVAWENSKEKIIESTRVMESPLSNASSFIVSEKIASEQGPVEEFDNVKFLKDVEELRVSKPVRIIEKDLPLSEEEEIVKPIAKKEVAKKPAAKKPATKKPAAKKPATKKSENDFDEYHETITIIEKPVTKTTRKVKKDIEQIMEAQLAEVDKILGRSKFEEKKSEKQIEEFGNDLDNFMKEMEKIIKTGK